MRDQVASRSDFDIFSNKTAKAWRSCVNSKHIHMRAHAYTVTKR